MRTERDASDQRKGARAPCRSHRPAASKGVAERDDRLTPSHPQGSSPTWVSAAGPNVVAEKHAPPCARAECAHRQSLHGCMERDVKRTDETMTQAVAAYTGPVTRCRAGRARAPAMKQTGEAHFRCTCGHPGTMPYPKLFRRLRRGKPMKLTCRKCGRVFRSGERAGPHTTPRHGVPCNSVIEHTPRPCPPEGRVTEGNLFPQRVRGLLATISKAEPVTNPDAKTIPSDA